MTLPETPERAQHELVAADSPSGRVLMAAKG